MRLLPEKLNYHVHHELHIFSADYEQSQLLSQQQQVLTAVEQQQQYLPVVAEQLKGLVQELTHTNQQLGQQWLASQQQFQEHTQAHYQQLVTGLTGAVNDGLADYTRNTAQLVADSMQPNLVTLMDALQQQFQQGQQAIERLFEQQCQVFSQQLQHSTHTLSEKWQQQVDDYQQSSYALQEQQQQFYQQQVTQWQLDEQKRGAYWQQQFQQTHEQLATLLDAIEQQSMNYSKTGQQWLVNYQNVQKKFSLI